MSWLLGSALLLLLAGVLYWELHLAEGAHLGARGVVWLYDLAAHRYEGIKEFDNHFDDDFLGFPLAGNLAALPAARVLDVAAGTGRLARSLLRQVAFDGYIVHTDLSLGMLRQAQHEVRSLPEQVEFLCNPADLLPFATDSFDAVVCLEALEFMPSAEGVIAECMRVLRPGGSLLLTNRIGPSARWLLGKTFSRPAFRSLLEDRGLDDIYIHPWQLDYDLAWARKQHDISTIPKIRRR